MNTPSEKPFVAVVGFDFSEPSELALDQALEQVARHTQPELHVVYVVPAAAVAPSPVVAVLPTALQAEALDDASRRLRKAVDDRVAAFGVAHASFNCRVVSHLRIDETSAAIAQLAADLEADLVVVGTHSRRGVARVLLGSVAHGVVTLSPCPVLVARPKRVAPPEAVIEPPCPACVTTRRESHGAELWCTQHRERHGRRHTYHQGDRSAAETNFPLVVR